MYDLTKTVNKIFKFKNLSLSYSCFVTNSIQDLFDNFSFLESKKPYHIKIFDEVLFRELGMDEIEKLCLDKEFIKNYSILSFAYKSYFCLLGADKKDFNPLKRNLIKTLNPLNPDSFSFFNPGKVGTLPFITEVHLTMESLFSSSNISAFSASNSSG